MSKKRSRSNRVKEEKKKAKVAKLTRKEKNKINYRMFWLKDQKMLEHHNEELETDSVQKDLESIAEIVIPTSDHPAFSPLDESILYGSPIPKHPTLFELGASKFGMD